MGGTRTKVHYTIYIIQCKCKKGRYKIRKYIGRLVSGTSTQVVPKGRQISLCILYKESIKHKTLMSCKNPEKTNIFQHFLVLVKYIVNPV